MEQTQKLASKSFITDAEKMKDFFVLTRSEFLKSYSYLTEEEYDATYEYWRWLTNIEYGEFEKTLDDLSGTQLFDAAMVLVKMKLGREKKGK